MTKILTPGGWKSLTEESVENDADQNLMSMEELAELMEVDLEDLEALSEEEFDEVTDEFFEDLDPETLDEQMRKKMQLFNPDVFKHPGTASLGQFTGAKNAPGTKRNPMRTVHGNKFTGIKKSKAIHE